jgi:hypothetical protein
VSERLDRRESLRAAWGLEALDRAGRSSGLLLRWDEVRRICGDAVARSLARWVLLRLSEMRGPGAVDRLARAACAWRAGLLGGIGAARRGFASVFEEATGFSPGAFERALAGRADELVRRNHRELAALPRLETTRLEVVGGGEEGRVLRFQAGPGPGRFALLHGEASLLAFEGAWSGVPAEHERDEASLGGEPTTTSRRYRPGSRVLWAFACHVPELGCDLVFGWQDERVP